MNFEGDATRIFDIANPENNPESTASPLSVHKRNVIRNSIQFNLNTAISTYDEEYFGGEVKGEFQLPILTSEDWDKILNNISMTSFMQGIPCGTTKFNNYSVVRSSNNNTSVSLENLYFTSEIGRETQSSSYYHKYDCKKLNDGNHADRNYYEADLSAEFKYDAKSINMRLTGTEDDAEVVCLYDDSTNTYYKVDEAKSFSNTDVLAVGEKIENLDILDYSGSTYRKNMATGKWEAHGSVNGTNITLLPNASEVIYLYDHQNLGCYECIISSNYEPVVKYFNGDVRSLYKTTDGELLIMVEGGGITQYFYQNGKEYNGTPTGGINLTADIAFDELSKRKRSVYTAIAKYRNSIYKTNDYVNR